MKKLILTFAVLVVVGGGFYWIATRPTKAPSEPNREQVMEEEVAENIEPSANESTYRVTSGSTAEFRIDEVLRGEDKLVIGTTENVSGTLYIDESDLAASTLGEIRVNARALATDEGNRDNMMRRFILQSEKDEFEFITFKPTQIGGLSGSATVGETVVFTVLGDLTIAGVTKAVPFDVEGSFTEEGRLEVRAIGKVRRQDFGLVIPTVPFVADVSDDVFLQLNIVAIEA